MDLSVIILTKNSASTLRRCLESVKWADEILVLDSGSTDDTLAICREYTSHIHETDWPGFGPQRIRALALATKTWVLSVDDDEELSIELQQELQALLRHPPANIHGFYLKHQVYFYGKPIRYACGNNSHIDFFRRESGQYTADLVHERVEITGKLAHLQHVLYHYTLDDISDLLAKNNRYSSLGAQKRLERRLHSSFTKALGFGLWAFVRRYILQRGFLDGQAGFILSFSAGETTYYQYLKMVYQDGAAIEKQIKHRSSPQKNSPQPK